MANLELIAEERLFPAAEAEDLVSYLTPLLLSYQNVYFSFSCIMELDCSHRGLCSLGMFQITSVVWMQINSSLKYKGSVSNSFYGEALWNRRHQFEIHTPVVMYLLDNIGI